MAIYMRLSCVLGRIRIYLSEFYSRLGGFALEFKYLLFQLVYLFLLPRNQLQQLAFFHSEFFDCTFELNARLISKVLPVINEKLQAAMNRYQEAKCDDANSSFNGQP